MIFAAFLAIYIYHAHYLLYVKFDYGYNMQVNIAMGKSGHIKYIYSNGMFSLGTVFVLFLLTMWKRSPVVTLAFIFVLAGVANSICWIAWSERVYKKQPYCLKAVIALLLFNGAALLEVLDFPPIAWTFDAHSLWHAATVPLPLLWYRCVFSIQGFPLGWGKENSFFKTA